MGPAARQVDRVEQKYAIQSAISTPPKNMKYPLDSDCSSHAAPKSTSHLRRPSTT